MDKHIINVINTLINEEKGLRFGKPWVISDEMVCIVPIIRDKYPKTDKVVQGLLNHTVTGVSFGDICYFLSIPNNFNQVGAVVVAKGGILGVQMFNSPELWTKEARNLFYSSVIPESELNIGLFEVKIKEKEVILIVKRILAESLKMKMNDCSTEFNHNSDLKRKIGHKGAYQLITKSYKNMLISYNLEVLNW